MKWALLISGIIELISGILINLNPLLVFDQPHFINQLYGLAAGILGFICILSFRNFSESIFIRHLYLSFMAFHAAVSMICFKVNPDVWSLQLYATFTHLAIFVIFLMFYLKDLKPDAIHNKGV